jgi:hypothetical protein
MTNDDYGKRGQRGRVKANGGRYGLAAFLAALLLALTLLAPARAEDREPRFKEYDARRMETLEKMAQGNNLNGAIARFYLGKDIDKANQIIMDADLGHWTHHICQFALYEMFNADNGHRAKLMSREATDKLHAHMWECFQPKHGKGPWGSCRHDMADPEILWNYWGNQNHGFVFQSWFYAAATALKDIPKYASQFDPEKNVPGYKRPEGKEALTLAGYADNLLGLWRDRFRWMAQQGLWAEDTVYRCYSIASLYNLAYHANDPVIRKRAEMMLDVHWLIYALHMVDSQLGGAMNRFKPHYAHYHHDRGLGSYYFGGPGGGFHATEVALYTDYVPPQIAYDLLANPEKRGCFTYKERLTQFSPETGQPPYTYKYSYTTPEYVLGSYIDLTKGPGRYHERAFNGITFGKARVMLRLGPGVSFQSYHCMQNGPILLCRWYGQELVGKDTPWGRRVGNLMPYASIIRREGGGAEVEKPVLEQGWLFGKAGDAYYALRPAAGEFAIGKPSRDEMQRFTFPEDQDKKIPFVVHAGGATEDGSFEEFKKNVLAGSMSYEDGMLTYKTKDWGTMQFAPYADKPADQWRQVNGEPVELPDKLFDSPYLNSDYNSGVITAEFNGRKLVLDFNKNERRAE